MNYNAVTMLAVATPQNFTDFSNNSVTASPFNLPSINASASYQLRACDDDSSLCTAYTLLSTPNANFGARIASKDFSTTNGKLHAYNSGSAGIWFEGNTLWSGQFMEGDIYVYNLADNSSEQIVISTDSDYNASNAAFIFFSGANSFYVKGNTIWMNNSEASGRRQGSKVNAYDFNNNNYTFNQSKSFTVEDLYDNGFSINGIWSDGNLMWMTDQSKNKVFAFELNSKQRVPSEDFNLSDGNNAGVGIWSDTKTFWVADDTSNRIYAYDFITKQRDPDKDYTNLVGNIRDLWSDGSTMWVSSSGGATKGILAYDALVDIPIVVNP